MNIPLLSWLCHGISLFVCLSVSAFSQSPAAISACVQDSTHAVIPGASVIVTRSDSSKRFQAQTNDKGCFSFDGIAAGLYRLSILAESFAPFEKEMEIRGRTAMDDITLEIQPDPKQCRRYGDAYPDTFDVPGFECRCHRSSEIEAAEARTTMDNSLCCLPARGYT